MSKLQLHPGRIPHRPETLGSRLRDAREAAGFTGAQLAGELEISGSMVSKWEHDKEPPRRMALMGYALLCQVDLAWLEELWTDRYASTAGDDASTIWYTALGRPLRAVEPVSKRDLWVA